MKKRIKETTEDSVVEVSADELAILMEIVRVLNTLPSEDRSRILKCAAIFLRLDENA